MTGIGCGVLMATLDASIINVSLPTMATVLRTSFAHIQWIILSYLLILTSLVLGVARFGDMYSKKKVYLSGMVLFSVSSLLCGLSPDVNWLIGFRVFQGLGAVMMQALGAAMVTEIFPHSERGRALGIIGAIVSIGLAFGPALGGVLIGLAGWRSIFLVNVPIGFAASLIISRHVPLLLPHRTGQRFDFLGAALMMITLLCYALGMTLSEHLGFSHPWIMGLLLFAALCMAGFIGAEFLIPQPMIELGLFRDLLFSCNLLMGLLVFVSLSGVFLIPFFLEIVKGYSTIIVGLLMMTVPLSMGLLAPLAGFLSDRFGSRGISFLGLLLAFGGFLALGTIHQDISLEGYILRVIPLGLGLGLFLSPNNSAIMGAVPREQLGVASGLMALSRTLGQTTGLPIMSTLFIAVIHGQENWMPGGDLSAIPPRLIVKGLTGTFHLGALLVLIAILLSLTAWWLDRSSPFGSKTG
jgi:EmrB/QacA subfamily drug resistance transporter